MPLSSLSPIPSLKFYFWMNCHTRLSTTPIVCFPAKYSDSYYQKFIVKCISVRLCVRDRFVRYTYVHMCVRGGHARNVDLCCRFLARRFPVCGFLACRFPASWAFICHKDGARFSTLKIYGRACNGFRARRARASTTCGAKQWALDIFTLQLHTLQMMKSWAGPRNEARVRASGAVESCSASLMVSVVDITAPYSQTHTTCKHMSGHTYTCSAQGMIWIYIPSNSKSVQFPLISTTFISAVWFKRLVVNMLNM